MSLTARRVLAPCLLSAFVFATHCPLRAQSVTPSAMQAVAQTQAVAQREAPAYRMALTPRDVMTVQWRPAQRAEDARRTSPRDEENEEFLKKLMAVLQNALIDRLHARLSLESVGVEKGRVRLSGVLLRDADIGLRLKNENARKLADVLYERYGKKPNAPSWTRVLPLAKLGIMNDLEIGLKLDELKVRELGLDVDALKVEGLALEADAGAGDENETSEGAKDSLRLILKVLRRAAISRAEAHLNLDHLAARRLNLSLDGFALQNLRITVALRRAEESGSANSGSASDGSASEGAAATPL